MGTVVRVAARIARVRTRVSIESLGHEIAGAGSRERGVRNINWHFRLTHSRSHAPANKKPLGGPKAAEGCVFHGGLASRKLRQRVIGYGPYWPGG